jgi:hypothetical protein
MATEQQARRAARKAGMRISKSRARLGMNNYGQFQRSTIGTVS